jgi:hypothetical protein
MENQEGLDSDQKAIDEELSKEVPINEIDPDTATPDEVKELITATKTLNAQKKHWRGKFEKTAIDPESGKPYKDLLAEAQGKGVKQNKETPPADEMNELKTEVSGLKLAEEKRQFGFKENLSPEETDKVFSYAQGANLKPTEALKDEFIKNAIDSMRRLAKTGSATPGPSSRTPMVEGKRVSEMKKEDIKKNWTKITGAE